jgi:hypothetical protein
MLLYMFDLKIKGKKPYNTLKRRFYYDLKNSKLSLTPWKTKSVLLVDDLLEKDADAFFLKYKGFIEVYKARVESINELTKPE